MLIPCEIAVKSVIPAIRALISKELTRSYGLKQIEIADLLGITQTAVSKYTRHVRGRALEIEGIEEIQPMIMEIVTSLANRRVSKYELTARVCSVCRIIRQKRFMCELCSRSDPALDIQQCFVCLSKNPDCTPK